MSDSNARIVQEQSAVACLQASALLRRRTRRNVEVGLGGEQALQAICHLLDALSRGFDETPATSAVERAALRLVDELQRVRPTVERKLSPNARG